MQTSLTAAILNTPAGQEADSILRSCVHCGFCTATCPTYQLLGDELDGPRGRIYLIKQMLEGQPVTRETQVHLDRCLTCRACETTCPSGVRYGRLADIGRGISEQQIDRPIAERLFRRVLRAGCAQSSTTPNTNAAAARVLDRLGISLIVAPAAGCCGALSQHLSAEDEALDFMRRNIDAWWPHIEQGIEAIVMTASGCGVMVKDYGTLLQHDTHYAAKAAIISALTRDLGEILATENLAGLRVSANRRRIAFHAPCTLQHGQKLSGTVEGLLTKLGYVLTEVRDSHLCCGSAGSYSLLQPELSQRLRDNKLNALQTEKPELIATANVGCQLHLATGSDVPVLHWIELLDES
ncbi:MAG: glycolate oxidase subunit GlcF [Gammaproteobacteria bacterium]|nr:glycolate oxidase subunit GlcF [Gammaproteobacteria bacterium]